MKFSEITQKPKLLLGLFRHGLGLTTGCNLLLTFDVALNGYLYAAVLLTAGGGFVAGHGMTFTLAAHLHDVLGNAGTGQILGYAVSTPFG